MTRDGKLQFTPASLVANAFPDQAVCELGPAVEVADPFLQIAKSHSVTLVLGALGVDFRRRHGTREWDNVAHDRTAFPAWILINASIAAAMVALS